MKALANRQTRAYIDKTLQHSESWKPSEGWIRTIRKTLSMTASQLARRLDTSASAVTQMERKEVKGEITLKQLEKAAASLNCQLVYMLVPERPIEEILHRQARRVAERELNRVDASMRLELQSVGQEKLEEAITDRTTELSQNPTKELWETEDVG
jgi:predicted DNA-binding mobile mystery protein A